MKPHVMQQNEMTCDSTNNMKQHMMQRNVTGHEKMTHDMTKQHNTTHDVTKQHEI